MTKTLLLVVLFMLSAIFQLSVVNSFTPPLALLPLHFLIGVLVLHRSGPELGASWFLASALVLPLLGFDNIPWYAYVIVASAGVFLTTKTFTNRSVYALEGMAVSLFLLATVSEAIFNIDGFQMKETMMSVILLVLGTYFGFLAAQIIKQILQRLFLVRTRHVS